MQIKLTLNPATEPPIDNVIVILFRRNCDNRGVTKSVFGYYNKGTYHYLSKDEIQNISHWAYKPEPINDSELL